MAGFKRFEDIIAWQLAYELKQRVDVFLKRSDFRGRFKYHDQLHDAIRSGPRNIAEGHMRGFKHREFAQFVRTARGSEGEVLNHLIDAYDQGLISAKELEMTSRLAKRAIKAASGLIRYLESTPDPPPPRYRPKDDNTKGST